MARATVSRFGGRHSEAPCNLLVEKYEKHYMPCLTGHIILYNS